LSTALCRETGRFLRAGNGIPFCRGWRAVGAMPKFYFDLVDDQTIFDTKGVTLKDLTADKAYAASFARELIETKSELDGRILVGVVCSDLQWKDEASAHNPVQRPWVFLHCLCRRDQSAGGGPV
jgi:hypothetical protein